MSVFSVSLKALLKLCCILGYNNVSVAFLHFLVWYLLIIFHLTLHVKLLIVQYSKLIKNHYVVENFKSKYILFSMLLSLMQ